MNKNKKQYIVVGSGISGVSCATALMKKKNVNVLMIDSGYELEQKLSMIQIDKIKKIIKNEKEVDVNGFKKILYKMIDEETQKKFNKINT